MVCMYGACVCTCVCVRVCARARVRVCSRADLVAIDVEGIEEHAERRLGGVELLEPPVCHPRTRTRAPSSTAQLEPAAGLTQGWSKEDAKGFAAHSERVSSCLLLSLQFPATLLSQHSPVLYPLAPPLLLPSSTQRFGWKLLCWCV
eukprot:2172744-Rhodomonas_salina.1